MTIDESEFETIAEQWLQRLCRVIEEASDDIDVELHGGVLTAELEDGRTFVLNKHTAAIVVVVAAERRSPFQPCRWKLAGNPRRT